MPVEAQTVEYSYLGDGVTTQFPFPSKFLSNSDLVVGLDGQEQTSGFVTAGAGAENGGAVTFAAAPAAGVRVSLLRRPPASQLIDFVNGQTVLEGILDTGLDKLTMIVQYLLRGLGRTLRVADLAAEVSPAALTVPVAGARAGKLLGFDPAGNVTVVTPDPAGNGTVLIDGIIGSGAVGRDILTAATQIAAQTAMGGTATGRSIFTAASAAAVMTLLGLGGAVQAYDTRALAAAANVPTHIGALTLLGYSALGDAPPVMYLRRGAQPAHPGWFQSADGAWWELSSGFVQPEHFGAVGSGSVNARDGVNDWLAYQQATGAVGIVAGQKQYRLDSALSDITRPVNVQGSGMTSSGFIRNHNGTGNRGVFHFTPSADGTQNPNGSSIRGIYCNMAAGTSGGGHITGVSTALVALGSLTFEDLYLTTFGSDTNNTVIHFDGQLKSTGAVGVRGLFFRNVYVFGANGYSMTLISVEGLWWYGGGFYAAGATNIASGGIQVTGTAAVPSTGIKIHAQTCSGLNLTRLSSARFSFESIGAIAGFAVANDGTCSTTLVESGFLGGSVTGNWASSGVRRFGAAWAAT